MHIADGWVIPNFSWAIMKNVQVLESHARENLSSLEGYDSTCQNSLT